MKFSYLLFLFSLATTGQNQFSNEASNLGIDITSGSNVILGGVSFFDFDNDNWDDLTFASKGNSKVRFFKNNNGTYSEISLNVDIQGHSKQVIWVDFDNDGDNDLFVTRVDNPVVLYENKGNLVLEDITVSAGFPLEKMFTYGATFGDYNNDGFLDVFLSNKDNNKIIPNKLFKNNGNGTFSDVSNSAGISDKGHLSFCAVFFDFNNDGFQDIYISNDRYANKNILYKNNGDETFEDVSSSSGAGIEANAMSTTVGDYNNDGWFDIYITNTPEGNFLLKNNKDGTFSEVANQVGLEFNSIGWGANFLDSDNDSDLDIYVSSMVKDDASGLKTSGFYECENGVSYKIPSDAGFITDKYISFANAIGDINNDGKVDIVVNNQAPDNNSLWKNNSSSNLNWLKIKLKGVQSNSNGIGNKIEISINGDSQYRYTACGEGFLGQNSGYEFFGVGTADKVDYVKVTWNKTGITETIINVKPNQALTIEEGNGVLSTNTYLLNFTLSPNPSDNYITISGVASIFEYRIYDLNGKELFTNKNFNPQEKINIENLKKGVYFIKITTNNKYEVFKFLKK